MAAVNLKSQAQPEGVGCSHRLQSIQHLNARIGEAGGAKFWFHALRNCFITVADRELMLPTSLTKRLVNHAPSQDITECYAADWTMAQLRDAAQRIADRIDELICGTRAEILPASQPALWPRPVAPIGDHDHPSIQTISLDTI